MNPEVNGVRLNHARNTVASGAYQACKVCTGACNSRGSYRIFSLGEDLRPLGGLRLILRPFLVFCETIKLTLSRCSFRFLAGRYCAIARKPSPLANTPMGQEAHDRRRQGGTVDGRGKLIIALWGHPRSSPYEPLNSAYYPLLGRCYVYFSTINQLPTQEGEKVRISTVVRVNN